MITSWLLECIFFFLEGNHSHRPLHFRKLYENKNYVIFLIFILTLLCDASKGFKNHLRRHKEVWKYKFKLIISLRPESRWEGLKKEMDQRCICLNVGLNHFKVTVPLWNYKSLKIRSMAYFFHSRTYGWERLTIYQLFQEHPWFGNYIHSLGMNSKRQHCTKNEVFH